MNDLIKNGENWPMGFRWANSWTFVERLVGVNSGSNSVTLACSGGGIDIDFLLIDTVTVVPEFTPKNNIFYSRAPRNIYSKMNAYGREITSIYVDGSSLSFSRESFPYEEDWTYETYMDTLVPHIPFSKIHVFEDEDFELLTVGENLLAVEIHQADIMNPDISIDARIYNRDDDFLNLNEEWAYYDSGNEPEPITYRDLMSDIDIDSNVEVNGFNLIQFHY